MYAELASASLAIMPTPTAHFGVGNVTKLGQVLAATGCARAVIVTDAGLVATPVVAAVGAAAGDAGIPVTIFRGVHANPSTDDLAAGADVVTGFAEAGTVALVAVGGGSSIDAAKGIALAAVNSQRGRELDYRGDFAARALPIVAIPTTAGTGAETNAFGVVTDPATTRSPRSATGSASRRARPTSASPSRTSTRSPPPLWTTRCSRTPPASPQRPKSPQFSPRLPDPRPDPRGECGNPPCLAARSS